MVTEAAGAAMGAETEATVGNCSARASYCICGAAVIIGAATMAGWGAAAAPYCTTGAVVVIGAGCGADVYDTIAGAAVYDTAAGAGAAYVAVMGAAEGSG